MGGLSVEMVAECADYFQENRLGQGPIAPCLMHRKHWSAQARSWKKPGMD
jgi:hypothetical protein